MEYVNEILSTAKRLKNDLQAEMDEVLTQVVARLLDSGSKITEARLTARAEPDYVYHLKSYNLLDAYCDYLDRFSSILDKYHYVVKSRIDSLRNIERKY